MIQVIKTVMWLFTALILDCSNSPITLYYLKNTNTYFILISPLVEVPGTWGLKKKEACESLETSIQDGYGSSKQKNDVFESMNI